MGGLSFSDRARRSMWRMVPKRAVSGAIGWGGEPRHPGAAACTSCCPASRASTASTSARPRSRWRITPASTSSSRANCDPAPGPSTTRPDASCRRPTGPSSSAAWSTAGKLLQAKGSLFDLASAARRRRRRRRGSRAAPTSSPTCRRRTTTACTRRSAGGRRLAPHPRHAVLGRRREHPARARAVRPQRALRHADRDGRRRALSPWSWSRPSASVTSRSRTIPRSRRTSRGSSGRRSATATTSCRSRSRAARSWASSTSGRRPSSCSSPGRVELDALAAGSSTKMGVGIGRVLRG